MGCCLELSLQHERERLGNWNPLVCLILQGRPISFTMIVSEFCRDISHIWQHLCCHGHDTASRCRQRLVAQGREEKEAEWSVADWGNSQKTTSSTASPGCFSNLHDETGSRLFHYRTPAPDGCFGGWSLYCWWPCWASTKVTGRNMSLWWSSGQPRSWTTSSHVLQTFWSLAAELCYSALGAPLFLFAVI